MRVGMSSGGDPLLELNIKPVELTRITGFQVEIHEQKTGDR